MPRWLPRVLAHVRRLATEGKVRCTLKALQELAELDLDADDALDVLRGLATSDSARRLASTETAEWMYVFRPRIAEATLYLKLVLRMDCVVVSFHEESKDDDEEEG